MSKKVLIATEKPFAKEAVDSIKSIVKEAGFELALLENYTDKADLLEAIKDVNAVIIRSDKITSEVIDKAEKLEIVVRAGAGYDNVDLEAATKKNIVVMNTPGQNSNAVAELAIGMMLYLSRKSFSGKAGNEISGKTVGIHGYGYIGKLVANIAKGFNMKTYAYHPRRTDEQIRQDGVEPVKTAEELYRISDFISLHLPSREENLGAINYELMKNMKEGAMIINTARTEVVDEPSLIKMFEERPDFKYATDVAPKDLENIAAKGKDNFYATPRKLGAQTAEANINAGLAAARQIVGFFKEGDTTFQVNK